MSFLWMNYEISMSRKTELWISRVYIKAKRRYDGGKSGVGANTLYIDKSPLEWLLDPLASLLWGCCVAP